jgi:hypothetical protein
VINSAGCSLLSIGIHLGCASRRAFNHNKGMGMQDKMESAKHYRLRAQESRTIAGGIFDHEERKKVLQIAAEFEQMALKMDMCEGYQNLAGGPRKGPNGTHKSSQDSS